VLNYGTLKAEIDLLGLINMRDDYNAALVLDHILSSLHNVKRFSEILRELYYNTCLVIMPGRGLERLDKYMLDSYDAFVICDSAVDYLSDKDYTYLLTGRAVLITDLDSDWKSLFRFCKTVKPILIVHAHGDNIDRLHSIKVLNYEYICGTSQVPVELRYVEYCDGFTDGDRALILASEISRRVDVLGYDSSITYSLKGFNYVKRVKLNILSYYIHMLRLSKSSFIY